ncbi:hypothetical protein [Butyrivibrio sp. JL13D10]|uniref:hypothetical protein n=1 Tax=Butyrivibrio sp. JL13D10 TaxID=3236815 RepID=UPI0038B68A09
MIKTIVVALVLCFMEIACLKKEKIYYWQMARQFTLRMINVVFSLSGNFREKLVRNREKVGRL